MLLDSQPPRGDDGLSIEQLTGEPMNDNYLAHRHHLAKEYKNSVAAFARLMLAVNLSLVPLTIGGGCSGQEQEDSPAARNVNAESKADARRHTLALSTEYTSYPKLGTAIVGQLVRELGRQALLIAARDELGIATRDQTLGELKTLSNDNGTLRLLPEVRSHWREPSQLSLLPVDVQGNVTRNPAWQTTNPASNLDVATLYPKLAKAWEQSSRQELVEGLRKAGLDGKVRPPNRSNQPSEEVQQLLGTMNFISQFRAVRLAHQAIAERGASAEWLEVLARGYAHLCSLTAHHWTSGQEAFAARALLYAERCGAIGGDERRTGWLRAYVLAIIGAHGSALTQIENLAGGDDAPRWSLVIEPFCRFERGQLRAVGEKHEDLKPLSNWLAVCHGQFYGTAPSFHAVAQECLKESPDAYGVYRHLVILNPSLSDQRFGGYMGPAALSRFVPQKLLEIEDLPDSLQDQLRNTQQLEDVSNELPDALSTDPFTPVPRFVFEKLREADRADVKRQEPSWSAIADLIEEEQFVMAASYCVAMQNAVESSHKEAVEGLLPLIDGHPFQMFIATYALSRDEARDGCIKMLANLEIPEPRHNMYHMLWRAANVPTKTKQTLGYTASWEALNTYDYRLPSMHEEITVGAEKWWEHLSTRHRQDYIMLYRTVSPHSPHWLRVALHQAKTPTPEQLEEWTPWAKKDAASARFMGWYAMNLGLNDKAIEWYQAAYEMEKDYNTTVELADAYRNTGQADKWLPTLERFLNEEEDLGLAHSNVHCYIATTYMEKDLDFARAKPHALLAAQAYSANGLATAMEACEGLAEWDEADQWAGELSRNYPSGSGNSWYFFCRRTGRGDAANARPFMTQYMAAQRADKVAADAAAYHLMEGDKQKSLAQFQQLGADTSEVYWYLLSSLIADDLTDDGTRNRMIAAARNLSTNYLAQNDVNLNAVIQRFCDLATATEPAISDEKRLALEADMAKLPPATRRDYECFLGRLLELRGDMPNADRLLVNCVSTPPFRNLSATIAGYFLVQRHGVSRELALAPPPNLKE